MSDFTLLQKARKRFKLSREAWDENREKMLNDLEFLNGDQWPSDIKAERGEDDRPCLTINRLPSFCDQVEGDQRQNRPSIKVRPVDSFGDPEVAKIYEGLIRNIEVSSQANIAYTNASTSQIACGMGYFRVVTDYVEDDVFEQEIKIKPIWNSFTIHLDPATQEIDYTDANFLFITEVISLDDYEERFPGKKPLQMTEGMDDDQRDWIEKDGVRIAEYFTKEPVTKTIFLLADGQVVDELPDGITGDGILKQREVKTHKIVWRLIDGFQVLDGPKDWPSKYYPVVPVWGKELNIQGKRHLRGLIRNAKDSQRLYNYNRSLGAETLALAPKAPYLGTPKQMAGHEDKWAQAHKRNFPYLLYNPDPLAPGPPQRQLPGQIQTGIAQEIGLANEEMKATTGIFDPSLGARTKEASGKAIMALQREGDVATYAYIDNLARAILLAGKILIDLIPKIYDTPRIVRTLGEDGSDQAVGINMPGTNQETGEEILINDLRVGKFDVTVTVGPSYTTKRVEAADSMLQFIQAVPDSAPIIGDLVAKNMDWPGADQIAERLRKLLPPGLAEEDTAFAGPGARGPEEGLPPPVSGPSPEQEQAGEMAEIKIEQEKVKLEQERLKARKLEVEIRILEAKGVES